jgi:putative membrane protein insertion efficiency factor
VKLLCWLQTPLATIACHLCHRETALPIRRRAPNTVPKIPQQPLRRQRPSHAPLPQLSASQGDPREGGESVPTGEENVQTALKALRWYKSSISPALPRVCRFLPSCSEYSMQAYKEFGNAKGSVLMAWRLIRCNPLNFKVRYQGKYDPPKWPPVGFEWLARE